MRLRSRARIRRYPHQDDRFSLTLFVRLGDACIRARVFAPLSNVDEDPATGSAAAALGACLARAASLARIFVSTL